MKTELMHITGKGMCIVISDINPNDFVFDQGTAIYNTGIFSNVGIIADCIRDGKKIAAIKEVRAQTGWGLKEAKHYVDKYTVHGSHYNADVDDKIRINNMNADTFIRDHAPKPPIDLLGEDEFSV